MANQPPEKTFRIGLVSASVFKNTYDAKDGKPKRVFRTVVLQRRYQKDEGEWESASSFGLADLPNALRVLGLAQDYVESMEADVTN
jgi:hypothetical protein